MKLLLRALVFASAVYVAYSLCNVCRPSIGAACVSNTKFKVCVDGLPTGEAMSCPDGQICSEGSTLCAPSGSVPTACSSCGKCNETGTFACTGYNTFALCYGSSYPSSANFTCSGTLVCNVDSTAMCVDPLTTGLGGTCPSVVPETTTTTTTTTTQATTTTTPNPVTNSDAFCAWKGVNGRFDVTSDSTCKSYIYCFLSGGVRRGTVMQCVGQTLFNAAVGLCQVGTPARCLTT